MSEQNVKIVIERHPDCYVGYVLGVEGAVVGEGSTFEEALADVRSALKFHIDTFGPAADSPLLRTF